MTAFTLDKKDKVEKEKEVCSNCNGSGWVELGEVVCPVCQNVGEEK